MLGISAFARQCLGGAVMTLRFLLLTILLWFCFDSAAQADDFSYAAIAKRFGETRLDAQSVQEARMHGEECLVGLLVAGGADPLHELISSFAKGVKNVANIGSKKIA